MPTPFSDIYTKYNAQVEDADLLSRLTDEELSELLEIFLSKAKSVYFKSCKKDLTDVDNVLKQFNQSLDDQEQFILAEAIKYIWVERQLFKEEKLRNKIGNKDYQMFSGGNLIDKLTTLVNATKKNLTSMINSYSFDSFSGFN